ncbi:hypothetical protein QQZ08_003785 [Neonectria magnoliae]|uniref:Uncharacterized protein n=1 Tax=Neonectria magnoliae TaxID=2732573 RepID=A0ABR1I840_9HYPO
MTTPGFVRIFSEVEKRIARCKQALGAIKLSRDGYAEKVAAANAVIAKAEECLSLNPSAADLPGLQDAIVGYSAQLKELELGHKSEATVGEQQRWAAMKRSCDNMIATLGSSVWQTSLERLSSRKSYQTVLVSIRTTTVVIRHLDIEVLGCNAILAKKNDSVALDAYRSGSKHSVASIVAEGLGLMDHVPKCYVYDERMKRFKWQDAYEKGGPLVAKREFPVIYFNGLKFPERSLVGWLAARDL